MKVKDIIQDLKRYPFESETNIIDVKYIDNKYIVTIDDKEKNERIIKKSEVSIN